MALVATVMPRSLLYGGGTFDLGVGALNIDPAWRYAMADPFYYDETRFQEIVNGPLHGGLAHGARDIRATVWACGHWNERTIPYGDDWAALFRLNRRRSSATGVSVEDGYRSQQANRIVSRGLQYGGGTIWYNVGSIAERDGLIDTNSFTLHSTTIPQPSGPPIIYDYYVPGSGRLDRILSRTTDATIVVGNSSGEDRLSDQKSGQGGGSYWTQLRCRSVSAIWNGMDDAPDAEAAYADPDANDGEYFAKLLEAAYDEMTARIP
jgi:hypothetical protein